MVVNSQKAFTMVELIFVIVIIGILTAIAIPKFAGIANEAQKSRMEAFMGTCNRTIAPVLWATYMSTNHGSIKNITDEEFLSSFTELPKGVENVHLDQCADANATQGNKVADITTVALPVAEEMFCIDGDVTSAPRFAYSADMNVSLQHN